jgi:hypothetical protein
MKTQILTTDLTDNTGLDALGAAVDGRFSPDTGSVGFKRGDFVIAPLTATFAAFLRLPAPARTALLSLAGSLLLRFGPNVLRQRDRDVEHLWESFGMGSLKGSGTSKKSLQAMSTGQKVGAGVGLLGGLVGLVPGYGQIFSPFLGHVSESLMSDEAMERQMMAMTMMGKKGKKAAKAAQMAQIRTQMLNPPASVPATTKEAGMAEVIASLVGLVSGESLEEEEMGEELYEGQANYYNQPVFAPSMYTPALQPAMGFGPGGGAANIPGYPGQVSPIVAEVAPSFSVSGVPAQYTKKEMKLMRQFGYADAGDIAAFGDQYDYCGGDLACKLDHFHKLSRKVGGPTVPEVIEDIARHTRFYNAEGLKHDCATCKHDNGSEPIPELVRSSKPGGRFSTSGGPSGVFFKSGLIEGAFEPMGRGQFGEVNVAEFPFQIVLNSNVVNSRREASFVHEALHAITELYKLPLNHEALHTLAVAITTEVIPGALALKRAEEKFALSN